MDTQHFKKLLEEERGTLEAELKTVGRKNPDKREDWEATEKDGDVDSAEDGDVAEQMEEYETNKAILNNLEARLEEVNSALVKIDAGTYGICEISGEPIELDRLEANPAAKTCKKHMSD